MPPNCAAGHSWYANSLSLGKVRRRLIGFERPFVPNDRIIEERSLRRPLNRGWFIKHKLGIVKDDRGGGATHPENILLVMVGS